MVEPGLVSPLMILVLCTEDDQVPVHSAGRKDPVDIPSDLSLARPRPPSLARQAVPPFAPTMPPTPTLNTRPFPAHPTHPRTPSRIHTPTSAFIKSSTQPSSPYLPTSHTSHQQHQLQFPPYEPQPLSARR